MIIELHNVNETVMTQVETNDPAAEFEHFKKMLPEIVSWREQTEPLDQAKARYMKAAGAEFARKRDAIRWVDGYGYDCQSEDITNFMAAFTPLLVAGSGSVYYKVWLTETTKGVIERNYEQMQTVYAAVRSNQLEAYSWYEGIKAQINSDTITKIEELEQIYPINNGGE